MSTLGNRTSLEVRAVRSDSERRTFLLFPWHIYHNDPLWVPPLLPERKERIDPERGTFFKRGSAEFFIAWRGEQAVGTICAAEDRAVNEQRGLRDCMFGFFECVPDYEVACALFECAAGWGRSRGLQTLYGPFNLDYEDSYGILVDGRDRPPALLCGHTPPYYLDFVERYGFQVTRGENLAFAFDLNLDSPEWRRVSRLADRLRKQGHITIRGARMDRFEEEVDTVLYLLNTATAHLVDFIPWQRAALVDTMNAFRKIADPELILFAEVEGRAVGWFPAVPNLNEAFYHANGLRYPWDYLKLAWYMRRRTKSMAIKSVLVLPEYWNRGVAVLLADEMVNRLQGKGYEWVDLSLTSADNPTTPGLLERMGAKIYKRYRVYRMAV
jgi:GNAT superfamily N-acetyltransferase